jgi:hypothetical protein
VAYFLRRTTGLVRESHGGHRATPPAPGSQTLCQCCHQHMAADGWLGQGDSVHSSLASRLSTTCSRQLREGISQRPCPVVSSGPASVDSRRQHLLPVAVLLPKYIMSRDIQARPLLDFIHVPLHLLIPT